MVTKKTIQEYGCDDLDGFIDKMCEWLVAGDNVMRIIKKFGPKQKEYAIQYLSGSHSEEHIVLSKMISKTIKK